MQLQRIQKKKGFKKPFAVATLILLLAFILAGCGTGGTGNVDTSSVGSTKVESGTVQSDSTKEIKKGEFRPPKLLKPPSSILLR